MEEKLGKFCRHLVQTECGCSVFCLGPMKRLLLIGVILLLARSAGAILPWSFQQMATQRISGNGVVEIVHDRTYLWVGTNNGISRTSDGGATWEIFDLSDGLNSENISAMGFKPGELLVAGAHSKFVDDVEIPVGDGFNYTTNSGASWLSAGPLQASIEGMLAYDIATAKTVFYASCFYGGLIRSFDSGATWENVFVDTFAKLDFDTANFAPGKFEDCRNRYFSVVVDTSNLDTTFVWAGTCAGIQRFTFTDTTTFDEVLFYKKTDSITCIIPESLYCDSTDVAIGFHLDRDTLYCQDVFKIKIDTIPCPSVSPVADTDTVSIVPAISGNWVPVLGLQNMQNTVSPPAIWAAARPARVGDVMAVNWTRDGGNTWDTTLTNELVWNFAFQDTIVWAATSSGLMRSTDWGKTWKNFTGMIDFVEPNQKIHSPEFNAVAVVNDTIWAGGTDGLVRSTDNGATWRIFRAFVPIGTPGTSSAYAYPSPFSTRMNAGVTRIRYRLEEAGNVTVKIFDFALNKVRTVVDNQPRVPENGQNEDAWDGRDQDGNEVASGVYFFKVETPGLTQWGKVALLK